MGILVTVIILMIALNAKGGIMTDEKVMKRAAELGMVMKETSEPETENQRVPETSTQKNATQEEEHQKLQNVSEASETNKNESSDKKEESGQKEDSDKKETSGNDSKDAAITVKKGDVCRDVAGQLYDKGLVDDAEAFRIYMGQHDYAKRLHVGSFRIQKGMSYEEIARALTK